jgi:hypothetical protein
VEKTSSPHSTPRPRKSGKTAEKYYIEEYFYRRK